MDWWDWFREDRSIYEMAQGRTSLYVGDLEPSVTESELFDAFMRESYVSSVRVCIDLTTRSSLGYGYVFFDCPREAERALQMVNLTVLKGKYIRVMPYVHNPSLQKRGVGNIFIKNLEKSIDQRAFYDTFSGFGSILRWKVATDASGESKGVAFVQYNTEESAQRAIRTLNRMLLNDEQVYVGPFLQRGSPSEKEMFTDIYVKNLSKSLTDEELNTVFKEFGPTTSCVIIRDGDVPQGKSKGYGFVNFENPEDAEKAVAALNGKQFEEKKWFVSKSKKKYQRESELKRGLRKAMDRSHLCVVKKLDKRVTDEILKDFFSSYGTVTSCKVMRDSNGVSKGSGFVAFSEPEEASKAMKEINGETKIRKQVYMDHLVIALANATPEQQRLILGENLYPMVEQVEPESAEKITGMLIEMDQTQVLHLLESVHALESKVAEAMEILRTVNQQHEESPTKNSDHLKTATKSADNIATSLISTALDKKPRSSARVNRRKSARKRTAVLLTDSNDAFRYKAIEAVGVVGTVNQLQQNRDVSESQAENFNSSQHSKSFLSPNFRIPKPSSLARKISRVSTRERSAVLLGNRFDSLRLTDVNILLDKTTL